MKKLLLAIIISSIHYSSSGNYLVNQDGIRVTIQGHPHMVCYHSNGEIKGLFEKAKGSTIWLINSRYDEQETGELIPNWEVKITKPVCDLK
jgi:hypothetical protein